MTPKNNMSNPMRYAGLATQWLLVLLLAVWGGIKGDHLLAWRFPILTIILPLLALCLLFWQLLKELNKPNK